MIIDHTGNDYYILEYIMWPDKWEHPTKTQYNQYDHLCVYTGYKYANNIGNGG